MVRWLGMNAVYTEPERAILAALPVGEQAFLHTLKAFMEGELEEPSTEMLGKRGGVVPRENEGCRVEDILGAQRDEPSSTSGHGLNDGTRQGAAAPTVYTDPEDIPFGEGLSTSGKPDKRKRPVYALVWTWRQSRVFNTKRECIEKQRVWKKWYERQGWKVSSHATGYLARHPSGQSHSISLHEYDPLTHERLR